MLSRSNFAQSALGRKTSFRQNPCKYSIFRAIGGSIF
jgi:hypothetical protein